MAEASATTSSNTTCKPIDEKLFDLGCLGPALAIIVILACLKKRKKLKLEYCNGYPGLLIPINFLGNRNNRFTIAATFGATASTCAELFLSVDNGIFSLGGPVWLKTFQSLISVFVFGILFYPLFVCLTTDYKLVGSFLGFLYVFLRFCLKLAIDFKCTSSYEADVKRLFYIGFVGSLPTYACLVFIMIRFAVLLFMEVRKKWFQSESGVNLYRAVETGETCLVGEPEIEHVKKLINPGLNSALIDVKWYMKVIYFIYKPRSDFKFSTQLISTVVVAVIVVFQVCVLLLALSDLFKTALKHSCAGSDVCLSLIGVLIGGEQAALIVSALISIMFLLQFMKCHRDHMLQLYRGERTFYQHMSVSPAKLVGRSLRFSGYQVAYTLTGYFILGIFLAFVCTILGFIFKYMKQIMPALFEIFKQVGIAALPTVGMAVILWLFQLFLAHFVFRDRDFPNITITVDNRRLFSIVSYFFFFYNILLGLVSSIGRIVKGMVLGIVFLSRIDRTSLMQGFHNWDQAFVAYLGFINVLEAHSHPVMLMFCQLLINRNKDGGLVDSPPDIQQSVQRSSSERATAYTRELRLTRLSQKAVNRWHVAVTLLFNPSLIKYRKQSEVRDERTASLRSIQADVSVLVY